MANICSNTITVEATNSEWREISNAFQNNQIDWPVLLDGPYCNDYSNEITFDTKWSPTPWIEGEAGSLSASYPSVLFHYQADVEGDDDTTSTWFCNGEEGNKKNAQANKKLAEKSEIERFVSATRRAAEGIEHRVEIMPDGRVAADGENRFGECNILKWKEVKQISCGNWHTAGLCTDGSVVACGSNANGQCEVTSVLGKAVAVSCGRYHTAVLLKTGRVVILGNLEEKGKSEQKREDQLPLKKEDFPIIEDLVIQTWFEGWEKMNERIERIHVGDALKLRKANTETIFGLEVLNEHDETIGFMGSASMNALMKMFNNIKASVRSVTPLSQRRKGSTYAQMKIQLDYVESAEQNQVRKVATKTGACNRIHVDSWPPVSCIKSVYDAVIGLTEDGEVFIDGYCPCTVTEVKSIVKKEASLGTAKISPVKTSSNTKGKQSRQDSLPKRSNIRFDGQIIVTTGLELVDEEWVKRQFESRGGEFKPKFVVTLDYLIYNPDYRETEKLKRAKEQIAKGKQVRIMTLQEFKKMLM